MSGWTLHEKRVMKRDERDKLEEESEVEVSERQVRYWIRPHWCA